MISEVKELVAVGRIVCGGGSVVLDVSREKGLDEGVSVGVGGTTVAFCDAAPVAGSDVDNPVGNETGTDVSGIAVLFELPDGVGVGDSIGVTLPLSLAPDVGVLTGTPVPDGRLLSVVNPVGAGVTKVPEEAPVPAKVMPLVGVGVGSAVENSEANEDSSDERASPILLLSAAGVWVAAASVVLGDSDTNGVSLVGASVVAGLSEGVAEGVAEGVGVGETSEANEERTDERMSPMPEEVEAASAVELASEAPVGTTAALESTGVVVAASTPVPEGVGVAETPVPAGVEVGSRTLARSEIGVDS